MCDFIRIHIEKMEKIVFFKTVFWSLFFLLIFELRFYNIQKSEAHKQM